MKLAIMQPYFFPYIGYFQLINVVDKFILYDDVTFIKQGWINRNYILANKQKRLISLPLSKISSNKLISETFINKSEIRKWYKKFLLSIEQQYKKSPNYKEIFELIINIFEYINQTEQISVFNKFSIERIDEYLGIRTKIENSSEKHNYNNENLSGQDRVIDICKKENATTYINPVGGIELYDKKKFENLNIKLYFLKSKYISYSQKNDDFIPGLSILDVMMFNSPETINKMLDRYELI